MHTVVDVQNMNIKFCFDPYAAPLTAFDDDEHGAGRRLLRYVQEIGIHNSALVVTRWMGYMYDQSVPRGSQL